MILQQSSYLRRVQWDQGSSRRHYGCILLLLPILILLLCFVSTTTIIIHECFDNIVVMQHQLHIPHLLVAVSNIRQFLLFLYTNITTNLCCTHLTSTSVSASFVIVTPTSLSHPYIHRHHHTWNHLYHKLSIPSQQRDDAYIGTVDRFSTTTLSSSSTTINNNETRSSTTPDPLRLQQQLLTIPIFPLQKMVKLPTNNITLNLYESRYIQMIEEAVLLQSNDCNNRSIDHDHENANDDDQRQHHHDSTNIKLPQHIPMFGTIYTKNLPHIVTTTTPNNYVNDQSTKIPNNEYYDDNNENDTSSSGNTLIVPILESNMIGVLCIVTNHTTTTISNNNNNKNQNRKLIRINATGIFRFKIIEIVHSGYNTYDPTTTGNSRSHVPYIVAKVQLLSLSSSSSSSMNTTNPIEQKQLPSLQQPTPTTTTTVVTTNDHQLPSYIQNIITKYGCTLLFYYISNVNSHEGNNSTINKINNETITLYKNSWIQELIYYYHIESKHNNNHNNKTVTTTMSYQEQKQRLQLLIHPYQ